MRKSIKEHPDQMHFLEVPFHCPICGKDHSILMFETDYYDYLKKRKSGMLIQECLPKDMDKVNREKFITGYCDDCQKLIFGD